MASLLKHFSQDDIKGILLSPTPAVVSLMAGLRPNIKQLGFKNC